MDLSRQRIIVARSMREVRLVTIGTESYGNKYFKNGFYYCFTALFMT